MPTDANIKQRLLALAAFLKDFERSEFVFGTWAGGELIGPNTYKMPCVAFSDPAAKFVHTCYDEGWVLMDFDWPDWAQTDDAQAFVNSPDRIKGASVDDLAKILTVCIRQDRFCEGALLAAFRSGFLTAILRRADRLAAELT